MCDNVSICAEIFSILLNYLKTQKMSIKAIKKMPWLLHHVPDKFLTIEMYQKTAKDAYWRIANVHNRLKMAEMCNRLAMAGYLGHIPDRIKTQEMCNKAVRRGPGVLGYVPDHFKT